MKAKERFAWERIRKKGKLRFVFLYGSLFFGVPAGALITVLSKLFENNFSFNNIVSMNLFFEMIPRIIVFAIFGIIMGLLLWNDYEKRWKKATKSL